MLLKNGKGSYFITECDRMGYRTLTDNGVFKYYPKAEVEALYEAFNPLPLAQADAIALINESAGAARMRYVTNTPSQDATYQMKLEEAKEFKSGGYLDEESYPFILMEASETGMTSKQVADLVIETANQWKYLAAKIESIRRGGSVAVQSVTDWKECMTVAKGYIDQLEAI